MFAIKHKITFSETDPGGILFFAEYFKIAHTAYESFFMSLDLDRNYFIDDNYILPIVHSSADYLLPLRFGDEIECELNVGDICETSFELNYNLFIGDKTAARLVTKHVAVLKREFKKTALPADLRTKLKENQN